MARRFVGAVTLVLLASCGDSDKPQSPGALAGTYAITAIKCGSGTGPPLLLALINPPNTDKLTSTDGYALSEILSDGTCTISYPYRIEYPSASTFSITGAGHVGCSPSVAVCATLSGTAGLPDGLADVCGVPVSSTSSTFAYTAIPAAAGGTMTVTAASGPAATTCSGVGLANPLTYTMTKE